MAKKLEKYTAREHLRVAELKPECGKRISQNSGMRGGSASRSWLKLFEMCSEGTDCDKMPASIIEMNLKNIIEFEEGWHFIQEAIEKVQGVLEGQTEPFRVDECMMLYTLIYNMCSGKPPYSYAPQLYDKY